MMFKITKWTKHVTESGKDETIGDKPEGLNHYFRLLDDDGLVYAYGYSSSDDDDEAFEPLDLFGGYYGITEIQYYNRTNKSWKRYS